jgi:VanZ family protein
MLRVWRTLFVLSLALTLYLTLSPLRMKGPGFPGLDKIIHAVLFALNSLFGLLAFRRRERAVLLGLVVLSPTLEFLQGYVPTRSQSFADAVANWTGIALGLVMARRAWSSRAERHEAVAADEAR